MHGPFHQLARTDQALHDATQLIEFHVNLRNPSEFDFVLSTIAGRCLAVRIHDVAERIKLRPGHGGDSFCQIVSAAFLRCSAHSGWKSSKESL